MEAVLKRILKSVTLELRHLLEGQYDTAGAWQPGDLENRLTQNLFGIDIDARAVQIAEAALWMKAAERSFDYSGAATSLVAATASHLKGPAWEEFLAGFKKEPSVARVLGKFAQTMEHIDEIGSLSRPAEDLRSIIKEEHATWERQVREQKEANYLFSEMRKDALSGQLAFDDISDEEFGDRLFFRARAGIDAFSYPSVRDSLDQPIAKEVRPFVQAAVDLKRKLVSSNLLEHSFSFFSLQKRETITEALFLQAMLLTFEGIIEDYVTDAYRLDAEDIASLVDEVGVPAGWYALLTSTHLDRAEMPSELVTVIARLQSSRQFGIGRSGDVDLSAIRSQLSRLFTLVDGGPDLLGDEEDEPEIESDEEQEGIKQGMPIPAETLLEEFTNTLKIHPLSTYLLLKDGIENSGWRCLPEERRIVRDWVTVAVLRALGHRWPTQVGQPEHVGLFDTHGIIPTTSFTGEVGLPELVERQLCADQINITDFVELMGKPLPAWLSTEFFKHHSRQFKKRPLAWQIQSGNFTAKKSPALACLLYYQKFDSDTLPKLRTQYIGPLRQRMETELRGILSIASDARSDRQEKRRVELEDAVVELQRFDATLETVATTGFGPNSLRPILRQYAINDAMLALKCRWLRRLNELVANGPLNKWLQVASKTDLHPDFGSWIRARLRRGYLRTMDRIGRTFSELLAKSPAKAFAMPTAGEVALAELESQNTPTAIIFLDACRLDIGWRLAGLLNQGEPAQRANVQAAIAPIPSITALGMPFALPVTRESLHVDLAADGKTFEVTADGFDGDLKWAEQRRKWLKQNFDVKDWLEMEEVLDGESLKKPGRSRKLIAVHGDELDSHDGQLKLTGADEHLRRYVQAVRKLRDAGYNRVIIVTDHGFFHWQPDDHEIEDEQPTGKVLWKHRRAMVGHGLSHPSAVRLDVPQSNLEVVVPRSTSAFRTYGALGFFHGGATLQELIIPVIVASWPAKARKVKVVLKPVAHIASEAPRIQVQAAATGQLFNADTNLLSRRVLVKIKNPSSGKVVFKHSEAVNVEPEGAAVTIQLAIVTPKPEMSYGSPLAVEVIDADDEELLAREDVELKVDISDW